MNFLIKVIKLFSDNLLTNIIVFLIMILLVFSYVLFRNEIVSENNIDHKILSHSISYNI